MGCIRSTPDGSYSLEDAGSSVPLDLEAAELAAGFVTGAPQTGPLAWPARLHPLDCAWRVPARPIMQHSITAAAVALPAPRRAALRRLSLALPPRRRKLRGHGRGGAGPRRQVQGVRPGLSQLRAAGSVAGHSAGGHLGRSGGGKQPLCAAAASAAGGAARPVLLCSLAWLAAHLACSLPSLLAQKLNFFGGAALGPEAQTAADMAEIDHPDDRLVFLTNVWLDVQATFDMLGDLFAGARHTHLHPATRARARPASDAAAATCLLWCQAPAGKPAPAAGWLPTARAPATRPQPAVPPHPTPREPHPSPPHPTCTPPHPPRTPRHSPPTQPSAPRRCRLRGRGSSARAVCAGRQLQLPQRWGQPAGQQRGRRRGV